MNEVQKQELIAKTKQWIDDPLYNLFKDPVAKDTPDYYDIIEHPIDLSTILQKLNQNQYKTFKKWYDDIILMYENCLEYNKQDIPIVSHTRYLLDKFKEEFSVRSITDLNEWRNRVQKQMNKIQDLFSQSPVIQGIDPMIISIIKNSENKPPPKQHDVHQIATKLGPKLQENEEIRREVQLILKETEPNKLHDTIDVNSLLASSQYALFSYLEAKL